MNTETRHELIDLRSKVNKERDQEITVIKQAYLASVSNARKAMKDTISSITKEYRQTYTDKKAELIAENEV